jgi:hypothetical protein
MYAVPIDEHGRDLAPAGTLVDVAVAVAAGALVCLMVSRLWSGGHVNEPMRWGFAAVSGRDPSTLHVLHAALVHGTHVLG